jgi:hypothetical protein
MTNGESSTQIFKRSSLSFFQATTIMRALLSAPNLFRSFHTRKLATSVSANPRLRSLTPSASERAAGRFGPANLLLALEALHHDGVVAISDIVNENHLDAVSFIWADHRYTLDEIWR